MNVERDIRDFINFANIQKPDDLRLITRAHVIAWRTDIENRKIRDGVDGEGLLVFRSPAPATIRRKLSALANALCEKNAVLLNPVLG